MSAVLRAAGDDFDSQAYLRDSTLPGVQGWNRGDPMFPRSEGKRCKSSGVHAEVSPADFDEFQQQVADATKFLPEHIDEIRRLRNFPGVESVTIDFGIWRRDLFAEYKESPEELVRLAGSLGLSLTLSIYWGDDSHANPHSERV
jgi:hypothetical protein